MCINAPHLTICLGEMDDHVQYSSWSKVKEEVVYAIGSGLSCQVLYFRPSLWWQSQVHKTCIHHAQTHTHIIVTFTKTFVSFMSHFACAW